MEPLDDYININIAKLDINRLKRSGKPEAILCEGKSSKDILKIALKLEKIAKNILFTRVNSDIKKTLLSQCKNAVYYDKAKIIVVNPVKPDKLYGNILIITAGTSDIPVAEESYVTALTLGNNVSKIYDIGVAGVHRVFDNLSKIRSANVIIVVAGMDGVLPTLIASLVNAPIIAVPSSSGYGTSFNGLSALLSMLNSCAGGVLVVSIDNGFGAAVSANIINKRTAPI
jgi:hypothetical protein